LILVLKLLFGLQSKQFDVETALMYDTLDEEIYMQFYDGYERYLQTEKGNDFSAKDHCVLLLQSLYGLVQAARQWYKKIANIFAKLDFIASRADPCLFNKCNEPPAFIILYDDDVAIIGTDKVINEVMTALCKTFQVKDLGSMKHFVGCHLIENEEENTIYIHQPKLIKHLEEEFVSYVTTGKITPGAPIYVVMRPEKGDPKRKDEI
jgi:Reverse transcriptase (RNA-dependent DNA polymerase)